MSLRMRNLNDTIEIRPTLDLQTLELLVGAARLLGLDFEIDCNTADPYRFYLHESPHFVRLKSNDVGDVARYLGCGQTLTEPEVVAVRPLLPTHVRHPNSEQLAEVPGPIPFYPRDLSPLHTGAELPRNEQGALDTTTAEFKDRRKALRLKTGYFILDCDKALRMADGDAEKALAKLVDTRGFASSKV